MNPHDCLGVVRSRTSLRHPHRLKEFGQRQSGCVRSVALALGSALCLGLSGQTAWAADWLAGVARTDITPAEPVVLNGYESRKDPSRGIHDPLSARAVAFARDGQRLVLVSIDNLGFYNHTAEPLRQAIIDACGLKPSELFLCAIHTHSAPTLTLDTEKAPTNNVAYTRALEGKLVELVRKALTNLAPVEISLGSGSSPVGVNRREVVKDRAGQAKIVLGRNPSLLTDREVQVLKLARPAGHELAAVLFAYATHSTSLGPKNDLISGDIHGLAEQFLERYLGGDVVVPGFAGASGNIDPWVRVLPDFRTDNGWVPEPVLLGTLLGEEVARVLEGLKGAVPAGPIGTAFKTLALPGKTSDEAAAVVAPKVPFNLTVGRLGDIGFVGWGGEVFNEIGQAVKNASPFRTTFIFTHCNGAAGYVPTRPSYAEGGYEVQSSPFAPGAAEQLIDATLQTLRELP